MKRLYLSIALFVALFGFGFLSLKKVEDCKDMISSQIIEIVELPEYNPVAIGQKLNELEEIWLRHHDDILHHVHHEKLDLISMELVRAKTSAKEEEYPAMREALDQMKWLVESVWDNEKVKWDNIF